MGAVNLDKMVERNGDKLEFGRGKRGENVVELELKNGDGWLGWKKIYAGGPLEPVRITNRF